MTPRVFFDASVLGAGLILSEDWQSIVYPGHPDWPLKQNAADEIWLALVGDLGWVAVFRDKRIRYRPAERDALIRHRVIAVSITTRTDLTVAQKAKLIEGHMPKIEGLAGKPPAYHTLNASGLRKQDLY